MLDLRAQLSSESEKNQLNLIQALATMGNEGLEVLMAFLLERRSQIPVGLAAGKAYQVLTAADTPETTAFLQTHFPVGIVPLRSDRSIDYAPLQQLLAKQELEAADRLTLQKLCELAGTAATQRKWLYFTEVENFPITDLQTVNLLWFVYSEGKFGFSVQREIWLSVGKNWDLFWDKIGWRTDKNWTRYPQEFTWDLTAPRGHLPLSNQLRGVRVIASLLAHPAWTKSTSSFAAE
jgi:hypothetical protein